MGKYLEYVNGKKKKEESKTSSSSRFGSGNYGRHIAEKKIGMDTFASDLDKMNKTVSNIYNGWQTPETMENTLNSVKTMQNRVNAYQDYYNQFGVGTDLSDVVDYYKYAVDNWQKKTDAYGYYMDKDSFDSAMKQNQLKEKYAGYTFEQVQAELAKQAKGSDEYNYLSTYTDYSDLGEYDKAMEHLSSALQNNISEIHGNVIKPHANKTATNLNVDNFVDWDAWNNVAKKTNGYVHTEKDVQTPIGTEQAQADAYDLVGNYSDYAHMLAYKEDLQKARNVYALDNTFDLYKHYMERDDFAEKSQYVSNGDEMYEWINNPAIRATILANQTQATTADGLPVFTLPSAQVDMHTDQLNEDEKAVYNYIYETEGAKSANDFLKAMKTTLGKRYADTQSSEMEEYVDESGWNALGASVLSVPFRLAGSFGSGVELAKSAITGEEYDVYGTFNAPANISSDIRKHVGDNIEESTELTIGGQNVARFLYDTGMSMSDSVATMGVAGKATSVVMGTGAFQQTAREMVEAGEDSETVMKMALASGVTEAVFEHIGINNLFKIKNSDGLANIFKNVMKQATIEGLEEVGTEYANFIWDDILRGEDSEIAKMKAELEARGFSDSEINTEVSKYITERLSYAFAGGALSGGVMGGGASVSNYSDLRSKGKKISQNDRAQEMLNIADMTPKESETYKLYTEYAKKGVTVDNIKKAQLGNLYTTASNEMMNTLNAESETIGNKVDAYMRLNDLDRVMTPKSAEEKAQEQRLAQLKKGEKTQVSGKDATIEGIKMEDGKTVVVTSEGEVSADEMTFSNNDAILMSHAEGMEQSKADLFVSLYDGKTDVQEYKVSFDLAYFYGEHGYTQEKMLQKRGVLTPSQVGKIYETTILENAVRKQEAVKALNEKYGKNVVVAGTVDDSIIDYNNTGAKGKVNWQDLTHSQRSAILFVQAFAKVTGVNIVLTNEGMKKGFNGFYEGKTNTITLDIYAGIEKLNVEELNDSIIPTLSHELTHWMKQKAPAMYHKMREYVLNTLEQTSKIDMVNIVEYERNYINEKHKDIDATDDYAMDEILARACEDMLTNSQKIRELLSTMTEKEQKTFIDKVKELFQNLLDWVNDLLGQYKSADATSAEAEILRRYEDKLKELSKMWDEALAEAIQTNQSMQKEGIENDIALLEKNGVLANENVATVYSVKYILDEKTKNEVASDLAKVLGVSEVDAKKYLNAETSIASIVLNPKHREFLDYEADENEVAIKKNSDYPQGTVDFSTNCPKRGDFTSVMNRVMSKFKNHKFLATDLAKIRTIMSEEKITIPCGICFVEDRRQLDSIVAGEFAKALELYRNGSKIRPDGKPFNKQQLKALKMVENDTYTPSIYELITLEGRNALKDKNPTMESAWLIYNNARGMQSVRLLTNEAEYKREILKYSPTDVKNKNDLGGLRIYSFSDAVMQHLIDLVQVITDSALKRLCIQGYTKVNWYAKMVKDTGVKINRSLIPAGELGYHIEDGKAVLDYDTVEGIDINDKDFFDSTEYDNVGNILIGINEVQIRTAMLDQFVDYIIPFHTGQSGEVLKQKGIDKWQNYKNSQSERNISDGKKSEKQINIYTDVIQRLEAEGTPLKNKVQFVEKFLAVCKENGLIPRFSEFLNTDENGDYIYTEGYHKFIIDFKTFHPTTGEYLPQMPVKPNFDMDFIEQTLKDFVEQEKDKRTKLQPKMDKAIARIEKEVIGTQYSDRVVTPLTAEDYKAMKAHFGTTGNYNVAGYLLQDGYMLDFSGKHWGDTTSRTRQVDHRDIQEVIADKNNGFDSMVRMISNGNIRLMPESGGINLAVAPTKNQRTILRRYIDYMNQYQKEGFALDIDEVGGDTIKSFTYEAGTSADRILGDIDRYFKGGNQSELMRFHTQYSDRDSQRNILTEGQKEFFAQSQMRDENGNLMVMYHGTSDASFTVFDASFSDDGRSFFFTNKLSVASGYSGTTEEYAPIQAPKIAGELAEYLSDKENFTVVREEGEYKLIRREDGEVFFATSNNEEMFNHILEEWTDEGIHTPKNLKVYLNIVNPLVVDAKGRHWNDIPYPTKNLNRYLYVQFRKKDDGKYIAYWSDMSNQYEEEESAEMSIEEIESKFSDFVADRVRNGELGFEPIAVDKTTGELVPRDTRQYAYHAKKNGYDGVIINDVVDMANGTSWGRQEASTVAIAFDSDQVKSVANENPTKNKDIRFSDRVTDKGLLNFLNAQIENGEYATVYRSFQVIDGGLYAPMNAVDRDENGKNKKLGYRSELGQWEMATESPEIAQRYMDTHPDAPYAKFDLDGVDNKTNAVAYNPYLHASNLVLNDQFAGAYRRRLVTVECRVPLSEVGAYRAKYAKDTTGWAEWKAGTVAGKLMKIKPEFTRKLFISRYMLPVRIVPDSEVAQMYKEYLSGTDISVPWNVVTPSLRSELEKAGVNISYKDVKFGSKIVKFSDVFGNEKPDIHFSDRTASSIYDTVGELDSLRKQNAKLSADVERLKERLKLEKQVTKGNSFNQNQLGAVVSHLKNLAKSDYDSKRLREELKEIYTYIVQTSDIQWEDLMAQCYDVAKRVLAKQRPTVYIDDRFKTMLDDLRKTKISLSEEQMQEAKNVFGNNYRDSFKDKIILAKDGNSLDSQWQEWATQYPEVFDANISGADQITALYDIFDDVRNSAKVLQTYNTEQDIRAFAYEIYNQYWNVSAVRTMADKHDKEIKRLNFEHRKAMSELRSDNKKRLENQRLADAIYYGRIISKLRNQRNARVKEARELGRKRMGDYKDRVERNSMITKITKKALTLNEWLNKNSKDKHIPEPLKEPVVQMLNAIDFSSKQLLGMRGGENAGTATRKDISLKKALRKVHEIANNISKNNAENEKQDVVDTYIDLPDFVVEQLDKLSKQAYDIADDYGDNEYVLNRMSLEELEKLESVISTMTKVIRDANKSFAIGQQKKISGLAYGLIEYSDMLRAKKMNNVFFEFLEYKNATPYYVFKRMGEVGVEIFDALMDAQEQLSFLEDKVEQFAKETFTPEQANKWSQTLVEFEILDTKKSTKDKPVYKSIRMTEAQVMSLYCLDKRGEVAHDHVFSGGIRIKDIKLKGHLNKIVDEGSTISKSEFATIINSLTDEQKAVADKLQNFMSTVCAEWGNKVTLERWGIKSFTEQFYFPMETIANDTNFEKMGEKENSIYRLLNMSFTKSLTPKANNKLVVDNIFDVFTSHTTEMAKYNTFALPMLDFAKILGYSEKVRISTNTEEEAEGFKPHDTISVANSLKMAFGDGSIKYLVNLMKDLNSSEVNPRDEEIPKKLVSNYKVSAVGGNLRVVMLQFTSYVKASQNIEVKYLLKGLTSSGLAGSKKALENSGIALWKSKGHYDLNIARSVESRIKQDDSAIDKFKEFSLKGAEKADKVTWGHLWNACEYWAMDNTKFKKGSDEFNKAVAKRFRDIIVSTQVVDSMLTRSQIMRSKSALVQSLTAFMSEGTMTYNMLADAFFEWTLDARQEGKSYKSTVGKHGKKFAKSVSVFATTSLLASAIGAIMDAVRDDDEEKEFGEKYLQSLLKNFASSINVFGLLPIARDIVSIASGYSPTRYDEQSFVTLISAFRKWLKVAEGDGNVYQATYKSIQGLSQLSGAPMGNIMRDVVAMWNTTIGEVYPSLKIK